MHRRNRSKDQSARLAGTFAESAQERPASGRSWGIGAGGFEHQAGIGAEPCGGAGEQNFAAFWKEGIGRIGEHQVKGHAGRR